MTTQPLVLPRTSLKFVAQLEVDALLEYQLTATLHV